MTMFSTREVPWMKLGKLVNEPMTARDAAAAGGLNFEVVKAELSWVSDEINKAGVIDDRRAIVRKDTGVCLGIMAKDYNMLQYGEAFDFMDTVNPTYVAAGCLKGGRQGFMVVKTPEHFNVLGGDDPHDLYMILRTSHDGSRAVEITVQPLRRRCMNQLTLASFSRGVEHRWAVKHTTTMNMKLAEANIAIQKLSKYADSYIVTVEKLASLHVTEDRANMVLEAVLPDRPRRGEQIEKIIRNWHTSPAVGFDYTGWGLVNAASEYFEWGRTGGTPESRFVGAIQGQTFKVVNSVAGKLFELVA